MKLIVVDDEIAALSNFLSKIVDNTAIEYTMFNNDPLLAIEHVKKNDVDAAFLDVQMDVINGIDLAEILIAASPRIKIIFVSGYEQNESAIKKRLKDSLLGFCYKPYTEEQLIQYISLLYSTAGQNHAFIRTFGGFDLFIDNKPVKFSSSKSKELLALLVDKKGSNLQLGEAATLLWPEKNAEQGKILYRDAVWRLRLLLKEYHLSELVDFSRGQASVNINFVRCDFWQYINGTERSSYNGSYMPNYEWSIDTQNMLDVLK